MVSRLAIGSQNTVADKAIANASAHRDLFQPLPQGKAGGNHVQRSLVCHNNFQQLHHMRGREEVQPDHILRTRSAGGNFIHIQIGGVGGQDRALLADRIQLAKHHFLDAHLFKDRLDHQIHIAQGVIVGGQGQRLFGELGELRFGNLAALQGALQIARDAAFCGLCRLVAHLQHHHRKAGQQCCGSNTCTHGATTDNANRRQRTRGNAFQLRQLADSALREESMDHALTLISIHQFHEQFALALHARVKRQLTAGLNTAHRNRRRQQATALFQNLVIERIEINRLWCWHFAHGATGGAAIKQFLSIGQTNLARLTLFDAIQNTQCQRFFGANLTTRGDDIHRGLNTDQTWQTLGTTGTGHHPNQHFGQTHPRRWNCNAVMRGQCNLQPAPQSGPVQRRDHHQRRGLDACAEVGQKDAAWGFAKFSNVGPGKIGAAITIDQNRFYTVLFSPFDPSQQAFANIKAQRVHRRILRFQNRNFPNALVCDGICHSNFLSSLGLPNNRPV